MVKNIDITDPLNINRTRNIRNTNKRMYNCGGYALGTYSWYCPQPDDDYDDSYAFDTMDEAIDITLDVVDHMCYEFEGKIRVIKTLNELNTSVEYAVAFRISSRNDFHYVKKADNGHWYHKRGGMLDINQMTEYEVFNTRWCGGFYDGPIVLLAVKK